MVITQTDTQGKTHEYYRNRHGDLIRIGQATPVGIDPHTFDSRLARLRDIHPTFFARLSPGTWQAVQVHQHILGRQHVEDENGHLRPSVMCYACTNGLRFPWQE